MNHETTSLAFKKRKGGAYSVLVDGSEIGGVQGTGNSARGWTFAAWLAIGRSGPLLAEEGDWAVRFFGTRQEAADALYMEWHSRQQVSRTKDHSKIEAIIASNDFHHFCNGMKHEYPPCCSFWFAMVWSRHCPQMPYEEWLSLTKKDQKQWDRKQKEEEDQGFWRRPYLELCRQVGEGRGFIPCPACLLTKLQATDVEGAWIKTVFHAKGSIYQDRTPSMPATKDNVAPLSMKIRREVESEPVN